MGKPSFNKFIQAVKRCYQNKYSQIPLLFETDGFVSSDEMYKNVLLFRDRNTKREGDRDNKPVHLRSIVKASVAYSGFRDRGAEPTLTPEDNVVPIQRIFTSQSGSPIHRVVLSGAAGMGKSTFLKKLAYDWSREGSDFWQDEPFQCVILLQLQEVTSYLQKQGFDSVSLAEIIQQCCLRGREKSKFSIEIVDRWLSENEGKFCFLIDDYDEMACPEFEKSLFWQSVLELDKDYCLVSSRPQALLGTRIYAKAKQKLVIHGFDRPRLLDYLKAYLKHQGMSHPEQLHTLHQFLHAHSYLWDYLRTPVVAQLFCRIWCNSSSEMKGKSLSDLTLTKLFHLLIVDICRRYLIRYYEIELSKGKDADKKQSMYDSLEEIKDSNQDDILNHPQVKPFLDFLSRVAYNNFTGKGVKVRFGLNTSKPLFDSSYRLTDSTGLKLSKLQFLRVIANELGLLKGTSQQGSVQDNYYEFAHVSLQEFFAAKALAELFLKVLKTESDTIRLKELARIKYRPKYQLILRMVAGILDECGNPEAIASFFSTLAAPPHDVIGGHHLALLGACLDECTLDSSHPAYPEVYLPRLEEQCSFLESWVENIDVGNSQYQNPWTLHLSSFTRLFSAEIIQNRYTKIALEMMRMRMISEIPRILLFILQTSQTMTLFVEREITDFLSTIKIDFDVYSEDGHGIIPILLGRANLSNSLQTALLALLKDKKEDVLVAAEIARGFIAREDLSDSAEKILCGLLTDKKVDVDLRAVIARWFIARADLSDSLQTALLALLKDKKVNVRERVELARVLSARANLSDSLQTALLTLLKDKKVAIFLEDDEDDLLVEIARGLSAHHDLSDSVQTMWLEMVEDKQVDARVRVEITSEPAAHTDSSGAEQRALALLEDRGVDVGQRFEIARKLLAQADLSEVVQTALLVLLKDSEVNVSQLLNRFRRDDLACRLSARADLSDLVQTVLLTLLEDREVDVGLRCNIAIGLVARADLSEAVQTVLLTLLEDREVDVGLRRMVAGGLVVRADLLSDPLQMSLLELLQDQDRELDADERVNLASRLSDRTDLSNSVQTALHVFLRPTEAKKLGIISDTAPRILDFECFYAELCQSPPAFKARFQSLFPEVDFDAWFKGVLQDQYKHFVTESLLLQYHPNSHQLEIVGETEQDTLVLENIQENPLKNTPSGQCVFSLKALWETEVLENSSEVETPSIDDKQWLTTLLSTLFTDISIELPLLPDMKTLLSNLLSINEKKISDVIAAKATEYKKYCATHSGLFSKNKAETLSNFAKDFMREFFGALPEFDNMHYLALLTNRAGALFNKLNKVDQIDEETIQLFQTKLKGRAFEYCTREAFLLMRAYVLTYLLMEEIAQDFSNEDDKKHQEACVERMKRELYLVRVGFYINKFSKAYPIWVKQAIDEDIDNLAEFKENLLKSGAEAIILLLKRLNEGEELYIPTGIRGHAIYVCIHYKKGEYEVRVDNSQVEPIKDIHSIEKHPKYKYDTNRPMFLGALTVAELAQPEFINFLSTCLRCESNDAALNDIYAHSSLLPKGRNSRVDYPYKREQVVNNCVVKSHNIGMMYRFFADRDRVDSPDNRRYYQWFRSQERSIVAKQLKSSIKPSVT